MHINLVPGSILSKPKINPMPHVSIGNHSLESGLHVGKNFFAELDRSIDLNTRLFHLDPPISGY